jgi:hypothetical protein
MFHTLGRLLLVALLLLPTLLYAGGTASLRVAVTGSGSGAVATCSGASPTGCTLRETFEGSVECYTGGDSSCDSTWTGVNNPSTYRYATSPAPLQGTYSIYPAPGALQYKTITPADQYYFSVMLNKSNIAAEGIGIVVRDASHNALCVLELYNSYTCFNAGGTNCTNSGTLSSNTTYYLKGRAKKGTGTNAECEVWISTDGTTWGSSRTSTDGTWTAQIAEILFNGEGAASVMDDIRVFTGDISY